VSLRAQAQRLDVQHAIGGEVAAEVVELVRSAPRIPTGAGSVIRSARASSGLMGGNVTRIYNWHPHRGRNEAGQVAPT
jgi:hypothetical protein